MFAAPSALVVLAMGFLNSPVAVPVSFAGFPRAAGEVVERWQLDPWSGTHFRGAKGDSGEVVERCQLDSWSAISILVSIAGNSAFSQVGSRKGCLKAALEESDRDFEEEIDLGPVRVRDWHDSPRSIRFVPLVILTTCRLRC
jgi:hypothetical protein